MSAEILTLTDCAEIYFEPDSVFVCIQSGEH